MKRRYALLAVLLGVFVACGGDDGGGLTGLSIPDVRGTFVGTWSFEFTNTGTGQSATATCPASVTVSAQTGGSFSGSFIIQASGDCTKSVSGTISGTVRSDGGLNFSITVPGGNPNEFEDLTGCQFQSGDQQFTGTLTGNVLSVNASSLFLCPDGAGGVTQLRIVFRFNGSR